MSEAPDDWRPTTLGEFLTFQRGHDLPAHQRRHGVVPVVGSGGLTGHHDQAMAPGPGITIGRAANLGVPTFVEEDYWPLNTTLYVTNFHGNDVRFCYYLLRALDLSGFDSGSVQPMLNRNYIKNVRITIPRPCAQRRIAKILASLDGKIAVNKRICSAAWALGDAHFLNATNDVLIRRRSLDELRSAEQIGFGDGYRTKQSEHGRPGVPILRVAEVLDGRIEPSFADFVSDNYRSAMGSKISRPNDVVLTTKGTVGRVAIIGAEDPSFVYSPQLCYFRFSVDSQFTSSYFCFWLRGNDFWRQAATMKSQTDMADYLSLADIRNLTSPVPESGGRYPIDSLLASISAAHAENKTLTQLRDTLLPRLISGTLRIREAEHVVEDAV